MLLLKTINGIGNIGSIDTNHTLHSYFDSKERLYYSHFHYQGHRVVCFSEKESTLISIQLAIEVFLDTTSALDQIKSFTQQQFTTKNSLAKRIDSAHTYLSKIILETIKITIPEFHQNRLQIHREVLEYWSSNQTDFKKITSTLNEFIQNAEFLNLNIQEYVIQSEDLNLRNMDEKPPTPSYDKITLLLDRYEEAAERSMRATLEVNGKNIASMLHPPVSPAAITDALKKNKSKIIFQLKQHPNKWPLIRKSLRPIQFLNELSLH
jgi:hypothetical protein